MFRCSYCIFTTIKNTQDPSQSLFHLTAFYFTSSPLFTLLNLNFVIDQDKTKLASISYYSLFSMVIIVLTRIVLLHSFYSLASPKCPKSSTIVPVLLLDCLFLHSSFLNPLLSNLFCNLLKVKDLSSFQMMIIIIPVSFSP